MVDSKIKNYDEIAVRRKDVSAYRIFGWGNPKQKTENVKEGKNARNIVMKRRLAYAENPNLAECEKKYFKLYKKKYRQKPILGILSFLLMLAFLIVAIFEIYIGVTVILDKPAPDKPAEETETEIKTGASQLIIKATEEQPTEKTEETADKETDKNASKGIKDIINDINTKYVALFIDPLLKDTVVYISDESVITKDEKDNEIVLKDTIITVVEETAAGEEPKTSEITVKADSLVKKDAKGKYITIAGTAKLFSVPAFIESIGIEKFLNTEILVGIVSFILFVIFLIIFIAVAKIKKKRKIKNEKLVELEYEAKMIINYMGTRDPSLLSKAKRKEMMWTNIIANGIRQANSYNAVAYDEDDDDE